MCLWLHLWYIYVILLNICNIFEHFFIISPLSFRAENNPDHLDPKSFDNIQDFFTKFKSLILSLGECGIDKSTQEKQRILTILAKLGPEYIVYVSNFHYGRCPFGTNWKMPTFAQIIESLTQE